MKLGKTLDLSKCFYDKDHWTHPDLKEGQLCIVKYKNYILLGKFRIVQDSGNIYQWKFFSIERHHILEFSSLDYKSFPLKDKSPLQEGWKHIQEVIV